MPEIYELAEKIEKQIWTDVKHGRQKGELTDLLKDFAEAVKKSVMRDLEVYGVPGDP